MHNVYLLQPQFSFKIKGEEQYWLPNSVACLWAYAKQFEWVNSNYFLADIIFKRENQESLLDRLENPSICAFSVYQWNEQYCLKLAKKIKKNWPNCLIVFGGPQVSESDLENYNFVDVFVLNEGEKTFVEILNLHFKQESIPRLIKSKRILDLNELPSPILEGIFDPIIKNNPETKWHLVLETNRGCPYSCTFCDWGSLTLSKVKNFDISRVEKETQWISKNPIVYLVFGDANFGIFKERDLAIAKMIHKYLDNHMIEGIQVSFAKNSNETIVDIAEALGRLHRGISLSPQSMNPETQEHIKRKNLQVNNVRNLIDLASKKNINSYSELILGLPGETLESWKAGICELISAGQENQIDVYLNILIKNSEISTPQSRERFGIKGLRSKNLSLIHNEPDDISEYIEIIAETSTMSTRDMIEAYIFSWIIRTIHIGGYSNIISKYSYQNGLAYKDYYETFLNQFKKNLYTKDYYDLFVNSMEDFFNEKDTEISKFWEIADNKENQDFLYSIKEHLFDIAKSAAESNNISISDEILELQKIIVFDKDQNLPKVIKSNYSINNLEKEKSYYKITSNLNSHKVIRNTGKYRNTIINIDANSYLESINSR